MSNPPPNENDGRGDPVGARFPQDVDPHRERERLVNVSDARAEVYDATARAAAQLGLDVRATEAEHRHLDLLQDAFAVQQLPSDAILDLTKMVREGSTTVDLRQAVLDHAMSLFGADKGTILEPDASGRWLRMAASRTAGQPIRQSFVLAVDEGVAGKVFSTGQREVIPDTGNCEFFAPNPDSESGPKYLVALPLETANERLGVLCLERPVGEWAGIDEVDRIHAFASHAARQLRGVRVFEDLQQRVSELSVLCEISRDLSGSLERGKLLDKIVASACGLLDCGKCSLMLFDDDKQTLSIQHAVGLPDEVVATVKVKPGEGVSGWVAERGEPLLIEDITQDARFAARYGRQAKLPGRLYTTQSLLSVPLLIGTEVVGVLNVNNKRNHVIFTGQDRDNLKLLASQAAVSIENARLYETLQRLAVTDPLTKLFRRNYFEEQVDAELSRCKRYKRPLSVMMLDIDHFKRVNDTYGHQAGDSVLMGLAGLLRRYGRKDDVIARFGGEEFVALLVETDTDGARLAAERVREAAQAFPFEVGREQPLRLTVSVGYSSFPDNADSLSSLVAKADLALYAAKHGGRNLVQGYTDGLEMPEGGVDSDRR